MLARLILRALLWPLWVRSCKCSFSCLLKFTTYFFFTTASLHQFGIVVGGKFIPFIYCGEVLGLKWDEVDLKRGTLQVRRTLSAAKSGPTFTSPKNNKSRSVRLTAQAVQALKDHR